jgi:hypothetical protein
MCRRAGEGPASQRIVGLLEASLGGVTLASVASARISSGDGSGAMVYRRPCAVLQSRAQRLSVGCLFRN